MATILRVLIVSAALLAALFVLRSANAEGAKPPAKPPTKPEGKKPDAKKPDAKKAAPAKKAIPLQARVEVKILEWTTDNALDYGFSMFYKKDAGSNSNLSTADMTFPSNAAIDSGVKVFLDNISIANGHLEVVIEALEQVGTVKVVSEPTVICQVVPGSAPGKGPATVTTGAKVPFESTKVVGVALAEVTEFRDVGLTLNLGVTEVFNDRKEGEPEDGDYTEYLKINISTQVTNLSTYTSVGKNRQGEPVLVPNIDMRRMANTVIIKDGQSMIVGVLKTTSTAVKNQGVPILSRIPFLGALFKNHSDETTSSELLFIVTPKLLEPDVA